jgi:hypothetical protein
MGGAIFLITIDKEGTSMARAFRLSSAIPVHNALLGAAVLPPVPSLAASLGFTRARQELL